MSETPSRLSDDQIHLLKLVDLNRPYGDTARSLAMMFADTTEVAVIKRDLDQLIDAGLVETVQIDGATRYRITDAGIKVRTANPY